MDTQDGLLYSFIIIIIIIYFFFFLLTKESKDVDLSLRMTARTYIFETVFKEETISKNHGQFTYLGYF